MTLPANDVEWTALCMWDEARGEPREGQAAVAKVISNRTKFRYQSDGTIPGTILKPMQFSGFWCDMVAGRYTRVALTVEQAQARAAAKMLVAVSQPDSWTMLKNIAAEVLAGTFEGFFFDKLTPRTVLYANLDISHPIWAAPANFVVKIGAHSFFTDGTPPAQSAPAAASIASDQAFGGANA